MSSKLNVKDLGVTIDALYKARAKRIAMEKRIELMKEGERNLRDMILEALNEAKLGSASGKTATATPKKVRKYIVADWSKYWKWASKDPGGNYVHKRIASEAVTEFLDANPKTQIPGLDWMDDRDLSLTKVGAKKAAK